MPVNSDPYYWTRDINAIQSQRRAVGSGRQFSPEEISNMVGANFSAQQQSEITQNQIAIQKRGMALEEQSAQDQKAQAIREGRRAAYTGTAQMALLAPPAIKGYMDIFGAGKAGTATQAATTGTAPAVEAGGTGAAGGTAAGGTEAAAAAEAGAGMGTGTVVIAGAGGVAGLAASSVASNWAARELNLPGSSTNWGAAGATLPFLTTTVFAPLAIGKTIWDRATKSTGHPHISTPIGSSIICTELNRQGLLPDSMLRASSLHVYRQKDKPGYMEFYQGYLKVAYPIVRLMKRSKLVTWIIKPYGTLLCRECASRESSKYKSTFMSKMVYEVSGAVYRTVYDLSIREDSYELA